MSIDNPHIYRRAAEILERDGMVKNRLFAGDDRYEGPTPEQIQEKVATGCGVCAIGACIKAEYELTGTLPEFTSANDLYKRYNFTVEVAIKDHFRGEGDPMWLTSGANLWEVNDDYADDEVNVATVLRRKAVDLERGITDVPVKATDVIRYS